MDPETVLCEQVPPATFQSAALNLVSDMICQQIPESTSQVEKGVQNNLGRKVSAGMLRLSKAERALQLKIMAAKRKINKLKNKVKKQTADIKEAKKMVASPAVFDVHTAAHQVTPL